MTERENWKKGTLVDWKDKQGFGFVRPEAGGRDYFIHISAFEKGMPRRPHVGDNVIYQDVPEGQSGSHKQRRIQQAVIEGMIYEDFNKPEPLLERLFHKALAALPIGFSLAYIWDTGNPIPLALYMFLSVLCIIFYGADKKRALQEDWRMPESYLHIFNLMGGWPGSLLVQRRFRHKHKKPSYQRIFWAIIILHYALWAAYFRSLTSHHPLW